MRKRPRPDQIVSTLGQIQCDLQAGLNIHQACRKAGIGLTTYYRWKARQENPLSDEQLRISELEDEVGRLKHLVAELALDRRMLQEALKKGSPTESVGGKSAIRLSSGSTGGSPPLLHLRFAPVN